jgi:predicted DNA-binding transcriptional regulator AlpA
MSRFLRFGELKADGIVNSWAQLKRLIALQGFPPGRMLGPNTRAWTEEEIAAWLTSRPVAGPAPRGAAKAKQENRKATQTTTPDNETPLGRQSEANEVVARAQTK